MCPLIYLKRKQTRALTLVVMCWAPGAQLHPFTLEPSRAVSTPTGPQLSSLSISTSGAWLQSGPPTRTNCREEAGGSLSETLGKLCSTWKTYPGWFCFFKNHSLQLLRGTGKINTRQREVPGLRRPFRQTGRSHEIHVHVNTGRRRPGYRRPSAVADHFTVH